MLKKLVLTENIENLGLKKGQVIYIQEAKDSPKDFYELCKDILTYTKNSNVPDSFDNEPDAKFLKIMDKWSIISKYDDWSDILADINALPSREKIYPKCWMTDNKERSQWMYYLSPDKSVIEDIKNYVNDMSDSEDEDEMEILSYDYRRYIKDNEDKLDYYGSHGMTSTVEKWSNKSSFPLKFCNIEFKGDFYMQETSNGYWSVIYINPEEI